MDKFASQIIKEAFDTGFQLYGIRKRAAMGDKAAQRYLYEAIKAAQDAGMIPPETMGAADPNAAAMAAADPNAAVAPMPPPAPTVPCPQCSNQVTPSPDGMCPVCGFDFNTLAAQAAQDAVAGTANEIKTAAVRYPQVMHQLMTRYGRR